MPRFYHHLAITLLSWTKRDKRVTKCHCSNTSQYHCLIMNVSVIEALQNVTVLPRINDYGSIMNVSMLEGFYTPFGRLTWRISEHHGPNTKGLWFTLPEENMMHCSIIELSHRTIHESDFLCTRFGRVRCARTYSYMNDASSLVAACGDESDTLFVNILKVNLFIMECSLIDFYCCTVVGSLYSM